MGFVGSLLYKEGRCGVTRKVGVAVRSRAGQCPAPTGWWVFNYVVYPVGCDGRQIATGGIYAAPTNRPVLFIIIYRRGWGGGFCILRYSPVVIGGTIWRESRANRVVIHSTICRAGVVIGSTVWGLLFPTQFKTVVIHGTFPLFARKTGLLSAAHFAFGVVIPGTIRRGCYPQHNCRCLPRYALLNITLYRLLSRKWLLNTAQFRVLLSAAHFPRLPVVIRSTFRFWVVIGGTFPKTLLFTAQFGKKRGCYSQHISFWGC